MPATDRLRTVVRLAFATLMIAALLAPIGCGSDRAERHPITGVDKDKPADSRPANPHDDPGP